MANKSMIDIAYEILSEKNKVAFSTLWNTICKKLGFTDEEKDNKVANFYTQLSLDGRFVAVGNNNWSLRSCLSHEDKAIKKENDVMDADNQEEAESDDTLEDNDEEETKTKETAPAEDEVA